MIKVYIGYDTREDIAYQVAKQSIEQSSSDGVEVYCLRQSSLRELGLYTRPIDAKASTEFSLTRFLTPWLAGPEGWSIFVDCDFLVSQDFNTLVKDLDPSKAVHVVQHDYTPAQDIKMDGKAQTTYPRKNWSSFILFNNAHPKVQALTPAVVNEQGPAFLHRFSWLDDDDIGALDLTWNFLVGEYEKPATQPACIHYTNGGPWFDDYQDVDFGAEWIAERDRCLAKSEG